MTRTTADASLPAQVLSYLERALPEREAVPAKVRVGQTGEMWLKPGANARRFSAVQDYAVREIAFSWRARFPLALLLSLRVTDRYEAGEGSLVARLLGLPVMRQAGAETSLGEALRYLAELPWVPHAMTANPQLEWRQLDEGTVEVAAKVGSERAAVRLAFDADGDITGARCEARPYPEGKTFTTRPWAGSFSDYARLNGVRVPTRGEVRWELPDGPFTYWRGALTSLQLDPSD
jgi:hypothetical protein